ncbi:polyprenyl synthetase family protein [Bacillus sp. FJAT-49711]|uniref:polyprenyl synthetase family protein n=1 Tax=Bacillus sp. FJAT-49711 TaxID=2833585 RepID=UPI001BCA2B1D|nr:farnesyl diphosphate synthase [Bacillus sp. FJAT-49711]MBS4217198.1 polyprenyl synthetase family protein [Bacillus sp. FJAT-49711]
MTVEHETFISNYKDTLEKQLPLTINKLKAPQALKAAMLYSLTAGGKRIRPILLFAVIDAFDKKPEMGLSTACALEMIHTYSLIHDDLPSMDDDDLRRGKPTNHKIFGEALAILAGDGLLTYSFQLIAEDEQLDDHQKVWLMKMLSACAGPEGMVGGQVADIQAEDQELHLKELEYIHHHKTGRLLTYGVIAGAKIASASEEELDLFEKFSRHLGLAFQISDDILDVIGDENIIGKRIGSDVEKKKSTYPSLLSLEGAKEHLSYHIREAKDTLTKTNLKTDLLQYLTDVVAGRDR